MVLSTAVMGRVEADVSEWATVYAALGYHDSGVDFKYASPAINNTGGNFTATPVAGQSSFRTWTGEAGVRGTFDMGPLNHVVNFNYSRLN
ncbi:MAG: TonB-dependent receptor, partial [Frankia sp.]